MSDAPTPRPKPTRKRTEERATTAPLPQNVTLIDTHGHVDHDKVTIPGPGTAGGAGSVNWSSNGKGGAKVLFDKGDGSPFMTDHFDIPDGGSVWSGKAQPGTGGKSFKYSVHGKDGDNDPVIVVDP